MKRAPELCLQYARNHPDKIAADYALSAACIKEENMMFEHQYYISQTTFPYLLEKKRYDQLVRDGELVFAALERIVCNYGRDPQISAYFSHLSRFEAFLSLPVFTESRIAIARYDLVETCSGDFKIIEPNTCCPGGAIFTAIFYDIFKKSALYKYLKSHIREYTPPLLSGDTIFNFLIEQYEQNFPAPEMYGIAIADTAAAPMETELFELAREACARGHNGMKIRIQDIDFDGRIATVRGTPIHILYQFLDVLFVDEMAQIAHNFEEIRGYMAALRHGALLAVNPFPPIFISEDKTILALLQDPVFRTWFSADEQAAIARMVPETYRLRAETVCFEGESHNLLALLKARKDDFLIKAQMESMGRDIVIGACVSKAEWEAKIQQATGGLYVAQRFVKEKPLRIPDLKTPERLQENYYTLALFFMGGRVKGVFNRISPHLVTNVAQQGAVQDVVVYEDL